MKFNPGTLKYVQSSDVFFGYSGVCEDFSNSEPDCTWGNNNFSLVTPQTIIDALEGLDEPTDEEGTEVVIERLKSIPEGVYVDLEN